MAGPRPAGAPWTPDDDRKLTAMIEAGIDKPTIARKLKRTVAAITSRRGKLHNLERRKYDLDFEIAGCREGQKG
jgi:hypothetical protein